jgi:hypothetical protein
MAVPNNDIFLLNADRFTHSSTNSILPLLTKENRRKKLSIEEEQLEYLFITASLKM